MRLLIIAFILAVALWRPVFADAPQSYYDLVAQGNAARRSGDEEKAGKYFLEAHYAYPAGPEAIDALGLPKRFYPVKQIIAPYRGPDYRPAEIIKPAAATRAIAALQLMENAAAAGAIKPPSTDSILRASDNLKQVLAENRRLKDELAAKQYQPAPEPEVAPDPYLTAIQAAIDDVENENNQLRQELAGKTAHE